MRIAICGGTFDPIHRGHIEPVLEARDRFGWDRVLYVTAFQQPLKGSSRASAYDRYAMTVLATEVDDRLVASARELERGRVSFTVETLAELRLELGPEVTIDWIIGADNLPILHQWKSLGEIFELANFVVLQRDGVEAPDALRSRVRERTDERRAGAIYLAGNPPVTISSTEIRERIQQGRPFEEMVDPRVAHYIHSHHLYRRSSH